MEQNNTTRRDLLKNIAMAGAAVATAGTALKASASNHGGHHEHMHHNHHKHGMHKMDSRLKQIVSVAYDCIEKGELCASHCIELFKAGDNSVAECMDKVQEMLPMCNALAKLAAHNSSHLKGLMQVCIDVCEDCEKACREHEDHHAECKACADSCAECIKVCKNYLA